MSLRRSPLTFWTGLAIMLACEALLFYDVARTHRPALKTDAAIIFTQHVYPARTDVQVAARWMSINITAIVWVGYLFFIEGILKWQGESPVRRRPHHFFLLCLASVFIWCVFDTINFYSIRAWQYIGMPPSHLDRYIGYFLAFGTIVPGMLLSGQALLNFGAFDWARSRRRTLPRWVPGLVLILGLGLAFWPVAHPDPITNFGLWLGLTLLLDPVNYWAGRPSVLRDCRHGWYGRILAACAGGLVCGLLWEFWNYWALTKWVYRLPFLGPLEHVRYFEMPVIGLSGFVPFGVECWVMWQTIRIALDGLAEPLPDERALI